MIEKMKNNWAAILFIVAIFSAGGTYATADIRSDIKLQGQVAANTTDRLLRAFERLEAKAARGPLSGKERVEFCNAARILGIGGPIVRRVCG